VRAFVVVTPLPVFLAEGVHVFGNPIQLLTKRLDFGECHSLQGSSQSSNPALDKSENLPQRAGAGHRISLRYLWCKDACTR
jgi:hypothetical protein